MVDFVDTDFVRKGSSGGGGMHGAVLLLVTVALDVFSLLHIHVVLRK